MTYRVKWKRVETTEGYVNDGDQDGDAWEGTRQRALKLAREMRSRGKACTYSVVLAPVIRRVRSKVPT